MRQPVFFDFDGVIADSFGPAQAAAQKICSYLTEHEYRKRFDGNGDDALRARVSADHGDACDHALDWLGEFVPRFDMHAKPFAGIPEVLKELAGRYALFIVSSNTNELIERFLGRCSLRSYIEGMYGADVNFRKDEKFRMLFSTYGITPGETVFVTDTLGDINEAANVSLASIAVTWGFQDRETLARGNPVRIIDTPRELPGALAAFFAERKPSPAAAVAPAS